MGQAQGPPPHFSMGATSQAQQVIQTTSSSTPSSGEMKSSKSVGDIMAEIKKEAEALEQMKIKCHRRKNSQTPPPISSSKNVMDDWIPWPDLDGSASKPSPTPSNKPSVNPLLDLDSNLHSLSFSTKNTCWYVAKLVTTTHKKSLPCARMRGAGRGGARDEVRA